VRSVTPKLLLLLVVAVSISIAFGGWKWNCRNHFKRGAPAASVIATESTDSGQRFHIDGWTWD
jgi:hypothetical protein